jgi:hypothetical protein
MEEAHKIGVSTEEVALRIKDGHPNEFISAIGLGLSKSSMISQLHNKHLPLLSSSQLLIDFSVITGKCYN